MKTHRFEFHSSDIPDGACLVFPPDACWHAHDAAGKEVARCAIWWSNDLPWPGHRIGVIGSYAASGEQAGAALLQRACEELSRHGCTMAVGPMDGNTWCSYRLVTQSGSEPPFWLEPSHPSDWLRHFSTAGFRPVAQYFSSLNADLSGTDARVAAAERRLLAQGITIRPMNSEPAQAEQINEDLAQLLKISTAAFRHNLLFQPISLDAFRRLSSGLRQEHSRPLVLIAERRQQAVAFVYAYPDACESQRSEPLRTMVIRTLAALPGRPHAGVGNLLLAEAGRISFEHGFRRAIHAMVRDHGHLQRLSSRHAQVIRRYALFGKTLGE